MKQFDIFESDGKHEYTVLVRKKENDTLYSLYASNSESWIPSTRGKLLDEILEDGNGVQIVSNHSNYLDYGHADRLRILLNILFNHDDRYSKHYKIVEVHQNDVSEGDNWVYPM